MVSCRNANILGTPGEGAHRLHIGGIALTDLLLTLGLALILSYIPGSPPFTLWIILLLLLSMVMHAGFCTKTSVMEWLYSSSIKLWIISFIFIILIALIIILGYLNKSIR
jgi:hypothetical protein